MVKSRLKVPLNFVVNKKLFFNETYLFVFDQLYIFRGKLIKTLMPVVCDCANGSRRNFVLFVFVFDYKHLASLRNKLRKLGGIGK